MEVDGNDGAPKEAARSSSENASINAAERRATIRSSQFKHF